WDFSASKSDYAETRLNTLATNDGRTWLTTYAKQGPLLSQVTNPTTGGPVAYNLPDSSAWYTIADAFIAQGYYDQEGDPQIDLATCLASHSALSTSTDKVVDLCTPAGGAGGGGGAGGVSVGGAGGLGVGGAGGTGGSGGAQEVCVELGPGQIDAET